MKQFHFILLFTLLFAFGATAQSVRKYSNEFLTIGVGAGALGKSGANVASVNDVTAGYWNPTGLLEIDDDFQVGAMHAEYFAGIAQYDYAGFAKPLDENSALGLSVMRFGVDDIPNTIDLIDANGNINYDRITTFSAVDYAFIISYARKSKVEGLSFGANAKVIYRQIGDFAKSYGFGLDAALKYQTEGGWKFAAMARDVTTTYNAWSYTLDDRTKEVFTLTGNEIPENGEEITLPTLVLGVAKHFPIKEKFGLQPEVNTRLTFDGKRNVAIQSDPISVDPIVGLEADYNQIIFLRAGAGKFQRTKARVGPQQNWIWQPNMGIGIRIKKFITIDYALTDIGDQSVALYSNIFSLKLEFNKR